MFAKNLKNAMTDRGMTQAEIVAATGIPKSDISQYLSGKFTPGPKALKRIADALNVPEAYLTGKCENAANADELKPNSLSVGQAARLMNKSEQFVRVGLQRGILPFGYAVKMSTHYTYYISPQKFTEYTGIRID